VRLNELVGTDLAAIHGVFAQVVFSLMVATAVLASNKSRQPALDEADVRRLRTPLKVLVGLVLLQVIWGAILRHADRTFAARLHLLTAFAVVGFAVWVLKLVRESDPARRYLKGAVRLLEVLLLVQLFLGVEAWFGKFRYGFDPELQPALTFGQAIIRTAHQLLGACLLATATALAVLVGAQARRAVQPLTSEASPNTQRPEQEGFLATSANRM
jgi:cytochrome c oxidase assembly protein subunit 15